MGCILAYCLEPCSHWDWHLMPPNRKSHTSILYFLGNVLDATLWRAPYRSGWLKHWVHRAQDQDLLGNILVNWLLFTPYFPFFLSSSAPSLLLRVSLVIAFKGTGRSVKSRGLWKPGTSWFCFPRRFYQLRKLGLEEQGQGHLGKEKYPKYSYGLGAGWK